MRISFKQFLGKLHSWSQVGQNLARSLKKLGHNIDLCSTNGYEHFPDDLKENIKCNLCTVDTTRNISVCDLDKDYDMQIAYTMMVHWGEYLRFGNKNRFAIWNYDGTIIPKGYIKHYKFCDVVMPSSEFSRNVFLNSGVPDSIMKVIPHGVDDEFFNRTEKYHFDSLGRKYKVLVNIAQNHTRKNIPGILDAWGKAFTDKDDVVMIAKVNTGKPKQIFEISWFEELAKMKKKYNNAAPIIVINNFIPYISDLYRACDIVFSLSNVECFNLPTLEGLVSDKIVIGSNWGGNVDFMNNSNSLLVNGKIGRAPQNMQYWQASTYGECFYPDTNHAVESLIKAVKNYDSLVEEFKPGVEIIKKQYTWDNAVKQILELKQ